MSGRWLPAAATAAVGALIGIGVFTFVYGRGYSYLSDDPEACINCHVMRDNHRSWILSSHRQVVCNDCHLPKGPVIKWLAKAENGFHHSWAFTFEDVQQIRIAPRHLVQVERNCISCHQRLVEPMRVMAGPAGEERRDGGHTGLACTRCHRATGHVF